MSWNCASKVKNDKDYFLNWLFICLSSNVADNENKIQYFTILKYFRLKIIFISIFVILNKARNVLV